MGPSIRDGWLLSAIALLSVGMVVTDSGSGDSGSGDLDVYGCLANEVYCDKSYQCISIGTECVGDSSGSGSASGSGSVSEESDESAEDGALLLCPTYKDMLVTSINYNPNLYTYNVDVLGSDSFTESDVNSAFASITYTFVLDESSNVQFYDFESKAEIVINDTKAWDRVSFKMDKPSVLDRHGVVYGGIRIEDDTGAKATLDMDLDLIVFPSADDYNPIALYTDGTATFEVIEDELSAEFSVSIDEAAAIGVAAQVASTNILETELLSSGYNSSTVTYCIAEYVKQINSIASGYVYVEPYPWPATLDDIKGTLQVFDGTSWSDLGSTSGTAISRTNKLRFRPGVDFSGVAQYKLWSVNADVSDCQTTVETQQSTATESNFRAEVAANDCLYDPVLITFNVESVNDAPVINEEYEAPLSSLSWALTQYFLPHVPDDLAGYDGFPVEQLANEMFTDVDDTSADLGLAIIGVQNDAATGTWQYLIPGGNWTDVVLETYNPSLTKEFALLVYAGKRECIEDLESIQCEEFGNDTIPLLDTENMTDTVNVFAMKPSTRLRFYPQSSGTYWTWQQAKTSAKLAFTAWDFSNDTDASLTKNLTFENIFCVDAGGSFCTDRGGSSSFATTVIVGEMSRLGCDGTPSSLMSTDDCGVCGGANDCYDCTNTPNGGAIFDNCGDCSGGSTGNDVNYRMDCAKVCGGNMTLLNIPIYSTSDSQEVCVPNTVVQNEYVTRFYCDGNWQSDATEDECGVCVGGSTGLALDSSIDVCGMCINQGGDGTSCLDCAGTVDGTKVNDLCDDCLEPTSELFNMGCVKMGDPSPGILWYSATDPQLISIPGANLANFDSITSIKLVHTNGGSDVTLESPTIGDGEVTGMLPVMASLDLSAGETVQYNIEVNFVTSSGGSSTLSSDSPVTVFGPLNVTSITPSTIQKGSMLDAYATLIAGFSSLGSTVLYLDCPGDSSQMRFIPDCQTSATYTLVGAKRIVQIPYANITDSKVYFSMAALSTIKKPMVVSIKAAHQVPQFENEITSAGAAQLSIQGETPTITGAVFSSDLCEINIEFNMNVAYSTGEQCQRDTSAGCCALLLDSGSVDTLGSGPTCFLNSKTMTIKLGSGASILGGSSVTLLANAVQEEGVDSGLAVYASGASGAISVPSGDVSPTVILSRAPDVLSGCDVFKMKVNIGGALGCANLPTLTWSIELADSSTSLTGSDLSAYNSLIADVGSKTETKIKIDGDDVPSGHIYNISVSADNYLGYSSEVIVHQFEKVAENAPVVVLLEGDTQVNPDDTLSLRTIASQPPCSTVTITSLSYQYSVDSTDFSMTDFKTEKIKLAGTKIAIRGGRTYTFTVRVTAVTSTNEALLYEASHTTVINMVPPIAYLEAPVKSGVTDELVLSADGSQELNKIPSGLSYTWSCLDYSAVEDGLDDTACRVLWGGSYVLLQGQLGDVDTVTIPGGTFTTGSYQFCVETRVGEETDSDCADVTVVANSPPSISMVNEVTGHNPNDLLIIDSEVCYEGGYLTMQWVSEVADGYNYLELDNVNCKMDITKTKDNSQTCKSAPLVCENLSEGSSYIFGLSALATDENGDALESDAGGESDGYVYRTVTVSTISAPSIQTIVVDPSSGTALQTLFEISVDGSDPQSAPITFQYFFVESGNSVALTSSDGGTLIERMLSPGSGVVRVVVTNSYGLSSSSDSENIVVGAFDESSIDVTSLATGGEALNMLGMLLTVGLTDPTKVAEMSSMAQSVSKDKLSTVSASDLSTGLENMGKAGEVTNDAVSGPINPDTLNAGMLAVSEIASGYTNSVSKKRRRRKRAVSSGGADQMSESDAETLLAQYDLVFRGVDSYDDVSAANSANFFSLVADTVMPSTCRDRVIGEEAIELDSDSAIIRIYRSDFVDVSDESMVVSCDTCNGNVNESATFEVGDTLESDYGVWTCDTGVECEGVCLASIQMPQDLLTASTSTASPLISNRRSDVIGVFLINPSTEAYISVNLTSPASIDFTMPISGEVNLTLYSLECRQWVDGDWTADTCVSNAPVGAYVLCKCSSTGYLAVFEGEVSEEEMTTASTDAVTTESSLTTEEVTTSMDATTQAPLVDSTVTRVAVQFTLSDNYATVVGNDKTTFINHIKPQIASTMNVSESRLENFDVRAGSIIISFDLVEDSSASNEASLASALQTLQDEVEAGSLAVTAADGTALNVDTSSFTYTEATSSSSSSTTVIIIVVVVVVVILIAVGVAVGLMYSKNQKGAAGSGRIASTPVRPFVSKEPAPSHTVVRTETEDERKIKDTNGHGRSRPSSRQSATGSVVMTTHGNDDADTAADALMAEVDAYSNP